MIYLILYMNRDTKTLLAIAWAIILWSLAHVAKYFSDNSDATVKTIVILSSIAISCFAWFVFWLLVSIYTDSIAWVILASSLGAYMWDKGIETAWEKVLDLISKK